MLRLEGVRNKKQGHVRPTTDEMLLKTDPFVIHRNVTGFTPNILTKMSV